MEKSVPRGSWVCARPAAKPWGSCAAGPLSSPFPLRSKGCFWPWFCLRRRFISAALPPSKNLRFRSLFSPSYPSLGLPAPPLPCCPSLAGPPCSGGALPCCWHGNIHCCCPVPPALPGTGLCAGTLDWIQKAKFPLPESPWSCWKRGVLSPQSCWKWGAPFPLVRRCSHALELGFSPGAAGDQNHWEPLKETWVQQGGPVWVLGLL